VKPHIARLLVRLYPREWRARYGVEFEALLEAETLRPSTLIDLTGGAALAHFHNLSGHGGRLMQTYPASILSMVRRPSAYVPLLMSLCALAMVLYFLVKVGPASPDPPHDEGAPAHIFQLLIAGQLPFLAYFALRGLASDWRAAMSVMALQALAIAAAAAIPFTLGW
jgi:hypothetical protein